MDDEKKRIYPMGGRENYNPIRYADIAMRNYARAKQKFEQLDFSSFLNEEDISFDLFIEHVITTVIFSTMCIEAYLNDYAAACLGDKEFYGSFDKLSIEGKFALIGKFILNAEIDKSKSYYYRIKRLVRERNEYTHSKSTKLEGYHRLEDIPEWTDDMMNQLAEEGIDPEPYREMLDSARNALLAIRDMALYFDANDAGADAIARLFCAGAEITDIVGNDIRNNLLKELHIENVVVVK